MKNESSFTATGKSSITTTGKNSFTAVDAVLLIVSILGLVCTIGEIFFERGNIFMYIAILCAALYIVQIWYLLVAYKKPHGNSFRISVVLYSWVFLFLSLSLAKNYFNTLPVSVYLYGASAMSVSYVSGRLNKFQSSSIQMVIVCVLMIVEAVYFRRNIDFGWFRYLSGISFDIQWIIIVAIYHFRFKEHADLGKTNKEDI